MITPMEDTHSLASLFLFIGRRIRRHPSAISKRESNKPNWTDLRVPHPRRRRGWAGRALPDCHSEVRRCFAGPRNLSQTRQGGAVRYGGLEMTAPPSQGEDGAPEGIKVAEERLPAGSYLTNVIKAGPVPANSAKVSSTPVTGRRGVRGAP